MCNVLKVTQVYLPAITFEIQVLSIQNLVITFLVSLMLGSFWYQLKKDCLNYYLQGYAAGGAVPSPLKNVERPFLSKYWSRWQADHTGRRYAAPSSLFGEMQYKVIRAFLFWFF